MATPASISDLIDHWRTIADFAADIGCGYEAARKMRDRNSISPDHWANVIEASEKREILGITFEWLAKQRTTVASAAASRPDIFDLPSRGDAA